VLIPENILAIPCTCRWGCHDGGDCRNHPAGHRTSHDFVWERERFTLNAVNDYLQAAPSRPLLHGWSMWSSTRWPEELAAGWASHRQIIPNVLDFETPPAAAGRFQPDLRREIGLRETTSSSCSPTRGGVAQGIEHAIELVRRLRAPPGEARHFHPRADEGNAYMAMLTTASRTPASTCGSLPIVWARRAA